MFMRIVIAIYHGTMLFSNGQSGKRGKLLPVGGCEFCEEVGEAVGGRGVVVSTPQPGMPK